MDPVIASRGAGVAEGTPPLRSPRLVGCILTRNEERNIQRAVCSLDGVAEAVFVADSESTDSTAEIAAGAGATVVVHPFESFPAQRNWALDEIADRFGDVWVLSIDADEWVSDGLAASLKELLPALGRDADVYQVKLRRRFAGRILRHGGFGHTTLTRLMPARGPRYEGRDVNEHLALPGTARIGGVDGWLEHGDADSWESYIDKHNRYSTFEAEARVATGREHRVTSAEARADPSLRKRFLRQHLWDRLPPGLRPALRFVQIFVVFAGFLDGNAGFRRALFEAWQEMCTDLKEERLRQVREGQQR